MNFLFYREVRPLQFQSVFFQYKQVYPILSEISTVHYDIRFVTTKAGFDRTAVTFNDPARDRKPARKGVQYSDTIGKTVRKDEATEATYKMETDDLYVRATVTSSKRAVNRLSGEPEFDTAWTQPYGWRLWQTRYPEKARLSPKK